MRKFIRVLITLSAIALAVAAVVLFLQTERLNKALNEIKPSAEANFSNWEKENNCLEDSLPCADYTKQFKDWSLRIEQYKANKEKSPKFQAYFFLKELDELYVPNLDSGGKASLALSCVLLLLWLLLIARLLGGKKKTKVPSIKTRFVPKPKTQPKPDTEALLRKATECSDNEPAQAINYLEQAIQGSLSTKLSLAALLMCGSLRLKNKIGEEQGKKQLNRVISDSPQSSEAEKAKTVLDMFK